jgi:anthranilate phosphoribosyltransferase
MNAMLEKLYSGEGLNLQESREIFTEIFAGKLDPIVFGSLLTAMKMNGYTSDEIGGAASAMKAAAKPFERNHAVRVGEIVGTGGDKLKTINISTIAGIICATLGLHVAKHGNTAVSSKTGASDVLSVLGYDVKADENKTRRCLEELGFAFFFAQVYHQGMRYAAPVRKALGTSTIFNILGPLCNPAHVDYELLGCYDPRLNETLAKALYLSGIKRAMVVNGNGMDEISIFGTTVYSELFEDGHIENGVFTKETFGIKANYTQEQLVGGTPEENARIALEILSGRGSGAQNAVVAANAAAMMRLDGMTPNLKEGFDMAMAVILSGAGFNKFNTIAKVSRGEI